MSSTSTPAPGGPRFVAAAPDSATIAELLAQDRHKLLLRHPFTGAVVMRLDILIESGDGLETAATDGHAIKVNPEFYASLDDDERLFVIAHEVWHCILMHFARRRNRDHHLFNIAADLEIHFLLTKEGFRPPFVLPHDEAWNGLSAEEIYELLQQPSTPSASGGPCSVTAATPQPSGGPRSVTAANPQSSSNPSSNTSTGRDAPTARPQPSGGPCSVAAAAPARWPRPRPLVESAHIRSRDGEGYDRHDTPSEADARVAVEKIRQIVVAAAQAVERTQGVLPGHLQRVVKAMLHPSFNWKTILARFVTSCYGGGRRWLPPSRRHVYRGLYLPSTRQERLRAIVAIDTSGSTVRDLPAFFTELCGLLRSFGDYAVMVLQCDHGVQSAQTFSPDDGPSPTEVEWKARGFGGTSFVPVFEYVDKHPELEPSLLVYFTDGYGTAPKKAPPYPVLWVLTKDGKPPAPWGALARFST